MKLTKIIKHIEEHPRTGFFYTPPIYPNAKSYFFNEVEREIKFKQNDNLTECLQQIDNYCESGLTGFGYITYELGYLLEERLNKLLPINNDAALFTFLFSKKNSIKEFNSNEIDYGGIENHIGLKVINDFLLDTSKEEYIKNVERIRKYIAEGDTYQVNYTVKSKFRLHSALTDLFAQLIFSQSAQYTCLINFGDKIVLSSSPELFFEIKKGKIHVKPMKGTIKRGENKSDDDAKTTELLNSEKDRAENIMIVDLLRNDIGKICDYGSVEVTNKYNLEKYESVYQLTSDVVGRLGTNKYSDILLNLFPSGSITGAPKIRTMEIINELEKENRGVYTGLIGMFSKSHSVANVAIRTLEIDPKFNTGELGIGSGIVWDSEPQKEYEEVLLKSKFMTEPVQYFELLESMLHENGEIFLLDYHFARLKVGADYFLFKHDEKNILRELEKESEMLEKSKSYKIRLTLSKWGRVSIISEEIFAEPKEINVIISNKRINSQNRFQYFKTTNRNLYEIELKEARAKGYFETIFLNEKENVAEGTISNILVQSESNFITPPLDDGVLNGCYRQYLLDQSKITENSLSFEQLINSEKVILINSVRKQLVVNKIFDSKGEILKEFK